MTVLTLRALVVGTALNIGCAAMTTSAPSKNLRVSQTPKCSHNRFGVAVDTVFGLAWGGVSLAALSNDEPIVALPFAALAALHTISGVSGNSRATKCENAIKAHDRWLARIGERERREEEREERSAVVRQPPPTKKTVTPKHTTRKTVPLPGSGEWKEFWREVSP